MMTFAEKTYVAFENFNGKWCVRSLKHGGKIGPYFETEAKAEEWRKGE